MVEYKNFSFKYPMSKDILKDINLNINMGEFVVIFGKSGCGKTTLIRQMLPTAPTGEKSGEVLIDNQPMDKVPMGKVGYVAQNVNNQIVTDKVWHELAFGLENFAMPSKLIRSKVMEIATYFGIDGWYNKSVNELSGGQKQILALASVMVTDPDILILDEPTSQLDPISVNEFMSVIKRLNQELGITIIITEHSLDYIFSYADRLIFMQDGSIFKDTSKEDISKSAEAIPYLPSYIKVAYYENFTSNMLITGNFRKEFLTRNYSQIVSKDATTSKKTLKVDIKHLYFRYSRDNPDVLNGIDLKLFSNQITCIIGANGSGKSTLMSLMVGAIKSKYGKIKVLDTITCLPQDVQTVFCKSTLFEDLKSTRLNGLPIPDDIILDMLSSMQLSSFKDSHPFDLSGGEQQMSAIAKILLLDTNIIIFDEPTRCLDVNRKDIFKSIIKELSARGKTIVIVSHDVDFTFEVADRLIVMFQGEIVSDGSPREILSNNRYFTTSIGRILGRQNKGYLIPNDFNGKVY